MDEQTVTPNASKVPELVKLPTGKVNVSFSELRTWQECSWRHKLRHVKLIDLDKPGVALDFGTSVHAAHENFIKTRVMDTSIATVMLRKLWSEHGHVDNVEEAIIQAEACLNEVPKFYEDTYPGWEPIDAEHLLYERVGDKPHIFKGYIDAIISAPGPRKKRLVWILDAKTTSWGWTGEKKADPNVQQQLIFYKHFWSLKTGHDPKDIRCGFLLLKRTAKDTHHCELVKVSVGDVTTGRAMKTLNNMLASVKRGVAIKNRDSCKYCPYYGTEHCT